MQGTSQSISQMLNGSNHYEIPAYQRDYQWDSARWQALVSDVIAAATAPPGTPEHWMGIFLISQISDVRFPGPVGSTAYRVIDGQQRLVTLSLWLSALAHHLQDLKSPDSPDLSGLAKVSVQDSDKIAFDAAVQGKWRDPLFFELHSHNIFKAYTYFRYVLWLGQEALSQEEPVKIKAFKSRNSEKNFENQWLDFVSTKAGKEIPRGARSDASALIRATSQGLQVYTLVHKPNVDESQAIIFDTLNGMRQELEPLDHVRNSLFVRIPNVEASDIYKNHWYPAETELRKVKQKRTGSAKAFIYDFVISQGEEKRQGSIKQAKGAVHFAVMTSGLDEVSLPLYLKSTVVPAMLAWPVVTRHRNEVFYDGINRRLENRALQLLTSIKDLNDGPTNPLALLYVTGYITGKVSGPDLISALELIEGYVARQIIGDKSLSPLRARMIGICATLNKAIDIATLKSTLLAADWVSDADIRKVAASKTYEEVGPRVKGALLRGMERHLSGPGAHFFVVGKESEDYSIEHIYPQKPSLWLGDLSTWAENPASMDELRETIGNLTAVTQEHNKKVGNKPFAVKRAFPTSDGGGAPMKINEGWLRSSVTQWTSSEIRTRSAALIEAAIKRWPTP